MVYNGCELCHKHGISSAVKVTLPDGTSPLVCLECQSQLNTGMTPKEIIAERLRNLGATIISPKEESQVDGGEHCADCGAPEDESIRFGGFDRNLCLACRGLEMARIEAGDIARYSKEENP